MKSPNLKSVMVPAIVLMSREASGFYLRGGKNGDIDKKDRGCASDSHKNPDCTSDSDRNPCCDREKIHGDLTKSDIMNNKKSVSIEERIKIIMGGNQSSAKRGPLLVCIGLSFLVYCMFFWNSAASSRENKAYDVLALMMAVFCIVKFIIVGKAEAPLRRDRCGCVALSLVEALVGSVGFCISIERLGYLQCKIQIPCLPPVPLDGGESKRRCYGGGSICHIFLSVVEICVWYMDEIKAKFNLPKKISL